MPDLHYSVPALALANGMTVDDERWPHVISVGYVVTGRKWVTFRAYHPDVNVYPNPPRRVALDDTVRILRSTLPVDYFGAAR